MIVQSERIIKMNKEVAKRITRRITDVITNSKDLYEIIDILANHAADLAENERNKQIGYEEN
jgi:hypothetical protein